MPPKRLSEPPSHAGRSPAAGGGKPAAARADTGGKVLATVRWLEDLEDTAEWSKMQLRYEGNQLSLWRQRKRSGVFVQQDSFAFTQITHLRFGPEIISRIFAKNAENSRRKEECDAWCCMSFRTDKDITYDIVAQDGRAARAGRSPLPSPSCPSHSPVRPHVASHTRLPVLSLLQIASKARCAGSWEGFIPGGKETPEGSGRLGIPAVVHGALAAGAASTGRGGRCRQGDTRRAAAGTVPVVEGP